MVPFMTAPAVSGWLKARFSVDNEADALQLKRRAAWFFRQFIKLGVAAFVPAVSNYFLIFDSEWRAL
jgi:hypothetical protein